ncbi:MAG: ABC-type Co2+ transport system periplasmic component-like protein [Caulobacter sp.]|nr:ABC-type Co2+ transport system periplasmic component-like protein [Caulobacter sp.]
MIVMRLLPLVLIAALTATAATAHESWLRPSASRAQVGQPITLGFTSGMAFPAPDTGPKPERVARLVASMAASDQPVVVVGPGPGVLEVALTPNRTGMAVVAISLKPHPIVMASVDVAEYFDEADPGPDVIAAWKAIEAQGEWRETYTKNAKALVCVETCAGDRTAMYVVGQDLEFVAMEPGPSPRRFRLSGSPNGWLENHTVRLFANGQPGRKLKTDARGIVTLPADVTGEFMLSAIWLRPPASPEGSFASDFTSIVVRP